MVIVAVPFILVFIASPRNHAFLQARWASSEMEERFRLQRAEQLQEERRQRPGDRLAERSRMPWFILVTRKSVKHYKAQALGFRSRNLFLSRNWPEENQRLSNSSFPLVADYALFVSASWKGGSRSLRTNPLQVPIGHVAAATTSCSKWLGQAPAQFGRGYGEVLWCFVCFLLLCATCKISSIQSLYHIWCLGELLASYNVENWYVPLWSSSHLSVKMTKKLPLDFLFP